MNPFFARAMELARQAATCDEVPVGAVIVHDGKIIAEGYNQKESRSNALMHAELIAIEKASQVLGDWRLNECAMYVTLEPCLMCLGALQQARIGELFYAATDPKAGAITLGFAFHQDARLNHRFAAEYVPHAEAQSVLSEFFKKRRQKSAKLKP